MTQQLYSSRKETILQLLNEQGSVSIEVLMKTFNVSHMTVRRDLEMLEREHCLIRVHGGAVKTENLVNQFGFSQRIDKNADEKDRICRKAAEFIHDGDSVFIDCGSTLFRLCGYIKEKKIRIITASLPVLSELLYAPAVSISLLGGKVIPDRRASYGPCTIRQIKEFAADKAFIGTDGLTVKNGLSAYDTQEGDVTSAMCAQSGETFLLCDSSKIGKDSFYIFSPLSAVQHVITDCGASAETIDGIAKAGIKVHVAE